MKGQEQFIQATLASDLRGHLKELTDTALRELLGYLGRRGEINDVAGDVWGACLIEATARFMERSKA